ncbi:MFS general substrate transporter [Amanita muscaria]
MTPTVVRSEPLQQDSLSCSDSSSPTTTVDDRGDKAEIKLTDQTNLLPFKTLLVVLLSLGLCITASTLDSVIIATAISSISATFNAGSVVSWVPAGFLLTSTVFQPLYGRFSDIFGRKGALTISMLVFIVGNFISGFSRTITQLILARAIAGAGGGGIISICQIIISDVVSLRERGKYQGIIAGFIVVSYGIGPILGGVLSEKVSWRWCFWFTIPIAAAAIAIVLIFLPLKPVKGSIREKLLVIDYLGTFLSLIGSTLVILPLVWGGIKYPWKSPEVLATLVTGLLVIVLFCLWEFKGAKLPIVPLHIFRHSTVVGVYIAMFVNGFVLFASIYYIPQYLQIVFGYTPLQAAVFLIPNMAGQTVSSWVVGVAVSRTGRYRTIIYLGFALWSVACGLTSTITPSVKTAAVVIYVLLAGIGAGQTLQTTTVAAQASVSRQDMSVVTAFRNFVRLLGGALAQAVCSSVINNTLLSSMLSLKLPPSLISTIIDKPTGLANPDSLGLSQGDAAFVLSQGYNRGFRNLFLVNASLTSLATITSVLLIKHQELPNRLDMESKESEKVNEKRIGTSAA